MTNKLRVYDSKFLGDTYTITAQMQKRIEILLQNPDLSLENLPPSQIPTRTLYEILICFEVMFNMMYQEHLVKDAHLKPTTTIH